MDADLMEAKTVRFVKNEFDYTETFEVDGKLFKQNVKLGKGVEMKVGKKFFLRKSWHEYCLENGMTYEKKNK